MKTPVPGLNNRFWKEPVTQLFQADTASKYGKTLTSGSLAFADMLDACSVEQNNYMQRLMKKKTQKAPERMKERCSRTITSLVTIAM